MPEIRSKRNVVRWSVLLGLGVVALVLLLKQWYGSPLWLSEYQGEVYDLSFGVRSHSEDARDSLLSPQEVREKELEFLQLTAQQRAQLEVLYLDVIHQVAGKNPKYLRAAQAEKDWPFEQMISDFLALDDRRKELLRLYHLDSEELDPLLADIAWQEIELLEDLQAGRGRFQQIESELKDRFKRFDRTWEFYAAQIQAVTPSASL